MPRKTPPLKLLLLIIVGCLAFAAVVLVAQLVAPPVLLGSILVLLAPGYALTAATFPRGVLETSERILLSLGLSMAVVIVEGFVLDKTPGGLQPVAWVIALSATTLAASGAAWFRRRAQGGLSPFVWFTPGHLRAWEAALLALALVLVAGAFWQARQAAAQPVSPGFTQLWSVAPDGADGPVDVGVRNMEQKPQSYDVRLLMDGQTVSSWTPVVLQDSQAWQTRVERPSGAPDVPVEIVLYRSDTPGRVYRRVWLWP